VTGITRGYHACSSTEEGRVELPREKFARQRFTWRLTILGTVEQGHPFRVQSPTR